MRFGKARRAPGFSLRFAAQQTELVHRRKFC
jgi:hypothetical protein